MEYFKIISSITTIISAIILITIMPLILQQILHNKTSRLPSSLSLFPDKLHAIFSISTIMLVSGKLGITLAINNMEKAILIYVALIVLSFIFYVLMLNKKLLKIIKSDTTNNVLSFDFRFKNMMYILSVLVLACAIFCVDFFVLLA